MLRERTGCAVKSTVPLRGAFELDSARQLNQPEVEAGVKRIDLETRAPEMLAEIKAALGNDRARFARAVAKPIVVDRELRRRFENDDRLHGAQRKQVETAREKILPAQRKENPRAAVLNAIKECTGGTVSGVTWQLGLRPDVAQSANPPTPVASPLAVKARSSKYSLDATAHFAQSLSPAERPSEPADKSWFESLSPVLRDLLRAQLKKRGDVSAVIETPEGFLLFVAHERTEKSLRAAALSVPKISFEQRSSARIEGRYPGKIALIDIAVLDVGDEDFWFYAHDGLPDLWQVQNFGEQLDFGETRVVLDPNGPGAAQILSGQDFQVGADSRSVSGEGSGGGRYARMPLV